VSAELRVLGGLGGPCWGVAAGRWQSGSGVPRRIAACQNSGMDPDYCITVPPGFDDSDDEAQVHPVARRMFPGRTPAEVFAKAQQWVGEHDVTIGDVSWNWAHDEPEPFTLAVYFTFEYNPYEEDEPAGA
jgi:hypothetical protein